MNILAFRDHTEDELQSLLRKFFRDKIRKRAYELYMLRGSVDGHALEDWLQAEAELSLSAARRQRQPHA